VAGQYIELFASCAGVHVDDLALIARHLSIPRGAVLDVGSPSPTVPSPASWRGTPSSTYGPTSSTACLPSFGA
jgi:hypothetical protein